MTKSMSIPEYMIDIGKIVVKSQLDLLKKVAQELDLDDEKYNELCDKYVDVSVSKMKIKKDKNAPKKPKTSYMFFCQDKRQEVNNKYPGKMMGETSKILGKMWAKLSEEEKEKYVKMIYEEAKKQYNN